MTDIRTPIEVNRIYCENCLDTMARMPDNSLDAIVTDPPYGISFMGQKWDYDVPSVEIWRECLRVLKPGGYLLAFAGTRTQHRMAINIEDAGFEIRDLISWVYGSGFPKSLNISKAIDKAAGAEREVIGTATSGEMQNAKGQNSRPWHENKNESGKIEYNITAPATDAAKEWEGFGTALKPAFEPITVARKPFKGTVVNNVLEWGTGGLNIDGCRVGESGGRNNGSKPAEDGYQKNEIFGKRKPAERQDYGVGRFPANFIHDGSDEVMALFPETTSGASKPEYIQKESENRAMSGKNYERRVPLRDKDTGSAARFFYTAKASASERGKDNTHTTVKPLALMRYLVRLVTPPGGLVYDPFAGSGTTIIAAIEEGFTAIGSDLEPEHCKIFKGRTKHGIQPKMF